MIDARPSNRACGSDIGADDPRYEWLSRRNFNKRFRAVPEHFRLAGSTSEVVDAVQLAVSAGRRVVARSGGHCLEGFVADADVRVVIDLSPMSAVSWDAEMAAFCVEAGTTIGEVHRRLFLGWGVVLPLGQSPDIGMGGHALGSAFGFLHRRYGLAGDHLYAVEVVVVDAAGSASSVIATREATDPNRELWWAHTGAGGGNFGVVTRYWFRSFDALGTDPREALPPAPESVAVIKAAWSWADIDEPAFTALLRNFGEWCERHGDAASPHATTFGVLTAGCRDLKGAIELRGMSIAGAEGEARLDELLAAVGAGVGAAHTRVAERSSWLGFALNPFPDLFMIGPGGTAGSSYRMKLKDALLRERHTDLQIGTMYAHLTRAGVNVGGGIGFATYGGRVNTVAPDATAAAQRSSIMDTSYSAGWGDDADEARSIAWVRELYRDVFAATGGVPVPGAQSEGALINHPDVDLADAEWNTSGVPWYAMYYLDNYPRLQRVKASWDPRNVFHHALSIRA